MRYIILIFSICFCPLCYEAKAASENGHPSQLQDSVQFETTLISEETIRGVRCHIATYSHRTVITLLSGPEKNKQLIFQNGKLCDVSTRARFEKGWFTHMYSWGKIITEKGKQTIVYQVGNNQ